MGEVVDWGRAGQRGHIGLSKATTAPTAPTARPMNTATHNTLMRELGALMNSMAGVNPDDDVAVLTETLKCVRTLNPRTTAASHPKRKRVVQRCVRIASRATHCPVCRVPNPTFPAYV
eukprot:COSAG02_NODE_1122_length_14450_cov_4.124173_9_plen_118_part_00